MFGDELEQKVHTVIDGFQDTMKLVISDKRILHYALPLSFIIWIFEILRVYVEIGRASCRERV